MTSAFIFSHFDSEIQFSFYRLNSRTQRYAVSLDFQCLLKWPHLKVCEGKYLPTFMDTLLVKMSIY